MIMTILTQQYNSTIPVEYNCLSTEIYFY